MNQHDHHLHLYGCINAEDLWRYYMTQHDGLNQPKFAWFETEYLRLTGRNSPFRSAIQGNDFDWFRREFEIRHPTSFAEFQARFNLIIAAHPDRSDDPRVLARACERLQGQGVSGADFRIFVPITMTEGGLTQYLRSMARQCLDIRNRSGFCSRLFLHLSRRTETGQSQWKVIQSLFATDPDCLEAFGGTDFCEDEQAYSVEDIHWLAHGIRSSDRPHADWLWTCHAGEVCDRISPFVSLQRLLQLAELGFNRIGHATTLGIPPARWQDERFDLSAGNLQELKSSPLPNVALILKCAAQLDDQTYRLEIDSNLVNVIGEWQEFVRKKFVANNVTIETCPSSNALLGNIGRSDWHPLPQLKRMGIELVVGSDDPGIFNCQLHDELDYFLRS
jgi:adenosine deaminase